MMSFSQSVIMVLIIALSTLFTRAIAFLLFPPHKETPAYVTYLGKVLPYAVIGMLIVYCFKDGAPSAYPYMLPELIASAVVVLLYLWKRNSLLSIAAGTAGYMILVQVVF